MNCAAGDAIVTEARLFVCSGAKVKATAGIAKNRHRVDLDSGCPTETSRSVSRMWQEY